MGCIYSQDVNRVEPILDKNAEITEKDRSSDKSELFLVNRNTRKTVPAKQQAREVKCVSKEQITAKSENAEKRRKEINEDMIKNLRNECVEQRAVFENIAPKQEFQKNKMVAAVKNREMRLKELRARLKEKHNKKSEKVRDRRAISEDHIGGSFISRPGSQTSSGLSFEIVQINKAQPEGHPARLETLSRRRKVILEKQSLNGREKREENNVMPMLAGADLKEKEELQMEKMKKAQINREKRLLELKERLRMKEVHAMRVRKMKDLNLDDLDDPP